MTADTLAYSIDHRTHRGHLVIPAGDGAPRPGVLVFPEAFGVDDQARANAARVAALGYVALAVDMYGDGQTFSDLDPARQATAALRANRREWRKRARAAHAALVARPEVDATRVAAIGYCFGGATAIELARDGAPLAAIATFHAAIMLRLADDQPFSVPLLACVGADDPLIPADTVHALTQELDAGGCDWQVHTYGRTVHSFTNPAADSVGKPEGFRYSAAADRRSFAAMTALLADGLAR